jgi:CRP-like cAMP-binding protein
VDLDTLVSWVQAKQVNADTWIFVPKLGVWQRAAQVPELLMFFRGGVKGSSLQPLASMQGLDPRALRRLKILAGMNDEQLERFVEFVEIMRVPHWATIVKQGDQGDAMYLVVEGELSVRMKVAGAETTLAKLGMGDFFGDISLFDHGPRSADVIADSSSVLLKISAAAFAQLARQAPDLATPFLMSIGKTLTARIRAGNKHHAEAMKFSRVSE